MGMHQMRKLLTMTTGIALAIVSSSAIAATNWSYNLSTQCPPVTSSNGNYFGTYSAVCTVSNPDLSLSGWSTNTGSTSSGTTFAAAQIYDWGSSNGIGVVADFESESSTGPHAMDNKYGTDMILLSFSGNVALNSVALGWNGTDGGPSGYTDSDISVLRYTGTVAPVIDGKTVSALLADGWSWVGDFGNVGSMSGNTVSFNNVPASVVYSSWWLVSAYDKNFDGNSSDTTGLAMGTDAVKLLAVAGNVRPSDNQTPEPGSLMLLGAGLFGIMAVRRRRQIEI